MPSFPTDRARTKRCSVAIAALAFVLLNGLPALAQEAARAALAVHVECAGYVPGCDEDYFQIEIPFAQFVRDPAGADVAVLVTRQRTGGGGDRFDLVFRGRRGAAAGRADTLAVTTAPDASDDDRRRAIRGRMALGLAGFAARTGLADRLAVRLEDAPASSPPPLPADDPWNQWVFRVNGNLYLNGQQRTSSANGFGSVSASRVTDRWKFTVSPNGSFRRDAFELTDGETFVSRTSGVGVFSQAVRALGPRTSAAARVNVRRSTFQNYALRIVGGPAVEFNVFPYAESTRRQLRLGYALEGEGAAYVERTLFDRTRETTFRHTGSAALVLAQPWGSSDVSLSAGQILTEPGQYRVNLGGQIQARLVAGLTLNVFGNASLIRDQINLPAAGATDQEILTRQRELATGYDYFTGIGLTYTFGSIFNPVVNARFGN